MKKIVWKVKGYCSNRDEDVFEAYFTDRDVAHEVYHKVSVSMGIRQATPIFTGRCKSSMLMTASTSTRCSTM